MRKVHPKKLTWDNVDITYNNAWHDGHVLPPDVARAWAAGDLNFDELLIGANSKDGLSTFYPVSVDGTTILPVQTNGSKDWDDTMDLWWTLVAFQFNDSVVRAIKDAYDPKAFGGNVYAAFTQADGDFSVACPARRLATQATAAGRAVYLYMFERLSVTDLVWGTPSIGGVTVNIPPTWASHAAELTFVFGNDGGGFDALFGGAYDAALSAEMRGYWASFAASGAPSPAGGGPQWPKFRAGAGEEKALSLGVPVRPLQQYRDALCDFWDPHF